MRIAQVAPLAESVPPKLYGGTERVVAWLIDELVELGHEVTLFASGDSATRAKLVAACPRALRLARPRADPIAAQATLLETVARHARDFDVIHCHIDWLHLPLLSRLGVPFVTTAHGRLDLPGLHEVVCRFPGAPFVSISDNQRKPLGEANWLGTVYHGLPAESLRPVSKSGSYLAFLGRLSKEKGPEVAMRIARAAGMPLRIAAKLPREERGYFKEHLEPQIDGDQVQLVGEVKDDAKQKFLGEAAALLFPIDWPEPFGLVMIEAMACGTPVIAFRRGSVPEIVDEGVTGFVVDEEPGAIRAIARLGELDRHRVRARFEQRFTAKRMAREYLRHYEALTAAAQPKSPPSDIATLVSGNLQACRLFASARGGSVSSPRSGSIPALRADVAAPIADADRSAPRLAGVGASFQHGCCVPQRWRFNPLGLAIRCIRVAVKAALRPLANTRSNKRHNGAAAQLRSFMFVEFVQRKRRPKWQETTGGMRNGSIAMTIGGDAQASALKVPAVIVMAEAQHGSMAATIAIMVLPMDKVEKTGVPARNPAAVVGTTEAAAIMDGAATGVLVPALRRESTDSAMRATGTIDRAMMIDSARTEIMAPITAAAEEPAATAETMAGTVAGQSTGMPAAGANGITTAAVGRARTTAAVRARSAAFGIERQMKFRPGSVMKKLCGAGSRTSGVAGRATIPAPAIASAKM